VLDCEIMYIFYKSPPDTPYCSKCKAGFLYSAKVSF